MLETFVGLILLLQCSIVFLVIKANFILVKTMKSLLIEMKEHREELSQHLKKFINF